MFDSQSRRSAGLAEGEEEYTAVHGHRRVEVDEDVDFERALSREKKQADETSSPSEGGSRMREEPDSQRFRGSRSKIARRNKRIWVLRVFPLDTNIFSILSPCNLHSMSFTDQSPQNKTYNEPRQILIRKYRLPLTYTSTRVRQQYLSQVWPRRMPRR